MTTAPTISVLMPVYNAARHLREAMDSILGQSFADFEFLCVNDGSTDDSAAILQEYANRDPRVVIVTKANGGVTSALNAGLKVARGEFIARMDADDIAHRERFAEQVKLMRSRRELVAAGCHVIHMDGAGVDRHHSPPITTHEEIAACLWNGNSSALPHYGAFMRRDVLASIGNYREQFRTAQDLDLFLRLSEVGKLANVPLYLMRYRVHEGSVGARKAEEQAKNAREILRQAYERKGEKLPRHLAKWSNVVVSTNRLRWGWSALAEGRYGDARGHAWNVLRHAPFRKYSWHLAVFAALGPWKNRLLKLLGKSRGTGVPPVSSQQAHGRDAHATPQVAGVVSAPRTDSPDSAKLVRGADPAQLANSVAFATATAREAPAIADEAVRATPTPIMDAHSPHMPNPAGSIAPVLNNEGWGEEHNTAKSALPPIQHNLTRRTG